MAVNNSVSPAKIIAGIVTYCPDPDRLAENLAAVAPQVDGVLVFDNGSSDVEAIRAVVSCFPTAILFAAQENLGIAAALNGIFRKAKEMGAAWVLTLDQDSVAADDLVAHYLPFLARGEVGILTCRIRDRNLPDTAPAQDEPEAASVDKCITSGSLNRMAAYDAAGGFDESLFIDCVDDDFCYAVREQGYQVLRVNRIGLLHELGHSREISGLGVVTNHSAQRKYYITRNSAYLTRKHKLTYFASYFVIYRRFLTVLLFEDDKRAKLKAMRRGLRDAKAMGREHASGHSTTAVSDDRYRKL